MIGVLIAYKLLGSLSEYMIVHQAQQRIELHRRVNEGSWSARILNPSEEIVLGASTGRPITVSFAEIYYETEVPEPLSE